MRKFLHRLVLRLPKPLKAWYWTRATRECPKIDVGYEPGFGRFLWPDEIVTKLHREMGRDSLNVLLQMEDSEGVIAYHHTTGRAIRNEFGFWREACPYSVLNDENHDRFPDQLSHAVLRALWFVVVRGLTPEAACNEVGLPTKLLQLN